MNMEETNFADVYNGTYKNLADIIEIRDEKLEINHYTNSIGLKGILENNTLWFTRWDFLNDPSERLYIYGLIEEVLNESNYDEWFKNVIQENASIEKIVKKQCGHWNANGRNYYFASFSLNDDSLDMWKYYAKDSQLQGYNFSVNLSNFVCSLMDKNATCVSHGKMIYDVAEQKALISTALDGIYKIYKILNDSTDTTTYVKDDLTVIFLEYFSYIESFIKHPAYKSEQEYRIVCYNGRDKTILQKVNMRECNGAYIPYVALEFDKNCIDGITLSPTLVNTNAENGVKTLLDVLEYKSIEIKQSELPFRNI